MFETTAHGSKEAKGKIGKHYPIKTPIQDDQTIQSFGSQ